MSNAEAIILSTENLRRHIFGSNLPQLIKRRAVFTEYLKDEGEK